MVIDPSMHNSWTFRGRSDVERFWREVRAVPRRGNGRKHHHEERYCLGLYLLALATHEMLTYPLHVEGGESPDFMLTWSSGETTGLEVARATQPSFQQLLSEIDHEYGRREANAAARGNEPEPVSVLLSDNGLAGDQVELESCSLLRQAIERKLAKLPSYRPASSHDLLVCDESRFGVGNRRKVFAAMSSYVKALRKNQETPFRRISVILSLDVAYDLTGDFRIFPYVEWSDPHASRDFGERAEYAGQKSVEAAIRGRAVYFEDSAGRIVKQAPDGRRFEVRAEAGGEAVVVREIPRS